jgi:hypothetical protein
MNHMLTHLTPGLLFYGPVVLIYIHPASGHWLDSVVQVLNKIVTPSLNPLIYFLRHKEVKLTVVTSKHCIMFCFTLPHIFWVQLPLFGVILSSILDE